MQAVPWLHLLQDPNISLEKFPYVWSKCSSGGFAEAMLATLNVSWPNADHIFLNNGKGGACLAYFADASCLDEFVPEHVDVILLDDLTNDCGPKVRPSGGWPGVFRSGFQVNLAFLNEVVHAYSCN